MKVIEPLEELKKDLEGMSGRAAILHDKRDEPSFLIRTTDQEGYVFRVNREGGLNITYPLTVNDSSEGHKEVIKTARKYFQDIIPKQLGADIVALNHFYQS